MDRSVRCAIASILLATFVFGVRPAAAQWRVDAQAGRLQYESAPDAATTTVALGLTHSGVSSVYGIAAGVPFTTEEPLWGALHGYHRFATPGTVRFGVDLAANGYAYRIASADSNVLIPFPPGEEDVTEWGAAAEAMPFVAWGAGPHAVEARAGVVSFLTSEREVDPSNRTAFLADALFQTTPLDGFTPRIEAKFVSAPEANYPYAGVGFSFTRGVSVWGTFGRWFDDSVDAFSWDAGVTVPVGRRIALIANGRHDALDPVYATLARTAWGAGVTIWLGELPASVVEPVPDEYANGVATIELDVDDATGAPSIAGDFNDWTPTPMTREGGRWVLRVPLEPGVYNYSFVDGNGEWFVPVDTPGRRSDGMGGHVAVLVVAAE